MEETYKSKTLTASIAHPGILSSSTRKPGRTTTKEEVLHVTFAALQIFNLHLTTLDVSMTAISMSVIGVSSEPEQQNL